MDPSEEQAEVVFVRIARYWSKLSKTVIEGTFVCIGGDF